MPSFHSAIMISARGSLIAPPDGATVKLLSGKPLISWLRVVAWTPQHLSVKPTYFDYDYT